MTKQEIFDKILETCADVCSVDKADIINACRKEDVCTARAILVFWCEEAGFSVESLVKCCECNNRTLYADIPFTAVWTVKHNDFPVIWMQYSKR